MALLIVDEVSKISNMAKLFFTELARKGNALYNVMPDVISGLSNPEAGIEEPNFREIMKYIIALIEKVGIVTLLLNLEIIVIYGFCLNSMP